MEMTWNTSIWHQFGAAIDMLRNTLRGCPDELWQKRLYNDTYPNMPSFGAYAVPDVDALVAYLKGDMQR